MKPLRGDSHWSEFPVGTILAFTGAAFTMPVADGDYVQIEDETDLILAELSGWSLYKMSELGGLTRPNWVPWRNGEWEDYAS
jgi:hypothetical protein